MGRRLIFGALYLALASVTFGQSAGPASEPASGPVVARTPGPRPVTKTEGRNILAAVYTVDVDSDSETDCSHLVHDVYERAGFSYEYASSRDLYIGSINFTRVRTPQAGDLVVWRGHVGIVIDPKEHSFYSFTRTGPDTQFYDSPYWRSRGIARFYRYMTEKPLRSNRTLEATRHADRAPLAATSRSSENRPPSAQVKQDGELSSVREADPRTSEVAEVHREIVLQVAGKNPAPDEVANAFIEMNRDSGKSLRQHGLNGFTRPIVVYRDLRVSGMEIKGKHGGALLSIESLGATPNAQAGSLPRWKEISLEFEKTKRGWVMSSVQDAAYVSREVALQALSGRLAELAQNAEITVEREREQKQIIRFLNLLVADDAKAVSAETR